jgi:hypothetical protein
MFTVARWKKALAVSQMGRLCSILRDEKQSMKEMQLDFKIA